MSSDRPFTLYHHISNQRSNLRRSEDCSASPSAETEASLTRTSAAPYFQQPLDPHLFSRLLFNRERVYRDSSAFFVPSPGSSTNNESQLTEAFGDSRKDAKQLFSRIHAHEGTEGHSYQDSIPGMVTYLGGDQMAPVSIKRGKPAKKIATKLKAKVEEEKPRKRPASRITVLRTTKLQKIDKKQGKEANTRKKVSGSNAPARSSAAGPIVIDDSDDADEDLPPKIEWPGAHITKEEYVRPPISPISKAPGSFQQIEPSSSGVETVHAEELRRLHQELEAVKAEAESVQRHMQQRIDGVELNWLNSDSLAASKLLVLDRELEAEREGLGVVVKERDQLQVNVNISKTLHDELAIKYQDLQHRYEQAQQDHETTLDDLVCSKGLKEKQVQQLELQLLNVQNENARLLTENENRKAEAAAAAAAAATATSSEAFRSTLSPTLSLPSSTDEEKKTDNIRKTYVKVKRRFDHLHKAANNLSTCARSMDLSSFGEFGQYLKQLRTALEDDSAERQTITVRSQDQDEGWIAQRFGV